MLPTVYLNMCNESAALLKFQIQNNLQKWHLPRNDLKKMITEFEETRSLTIRAGKLHKPVSEELKTEMATAIIEGSLETIVGSSSFRVLLDYGI